MKKLLLCIFTILFTTNVWGSGIAADATSATCDNTTLGAYSGTVSLEVNWIPNDVNVRYYDNNTQLSAPATCAYSGDLALPTPPSRTGYNFVGWELRPEMDFSTIPTDLRGSERWSISLRNNRNYCAYDTDTGWAWKVDCDNNHNELRPNEWKVKYEHGYLYGMAGCSNDVGEYKQHGTPTIGTGNYCWCKATGYKVINSTVISRPLNELSWVYRDVLGSDCDWYCAIHCLRGVGNDTGYLHSLIN